MSKKKFGLGAKILVAIVIIAMLGSVILPFMV
jgi:hypothetical protein